MKENDLLRDTVLAREKVLLGVGIGVFGQIETRAKAKVLPSKIIYSTTFAC